MTEAVFVGPDSSSQLDSVIAELKSEASHTRNRDAARTLLKAPDLRIVVVAIHRDGVIPEHTANGTVSIHALSGGVEVRLPSQTVQLAKGSLLVIPSRVAHEVTATEDSVFLLTLGWNQQAA